MDRVEDAIVLAGGMGTRMLPASLYSPKEAMPLVDTPVLNHLIWEAANAGVSRVHLVLSERKKSVLEEFIGGKAIFGEEIRVDLPRHALSMGVKGLVIIPYVQPYAGGVANAISIAAPGIDGPFLVMLGDMVILDRHVGPRLSGPGNASSASRRLVSIFDETGFPSVGVCSVERSQIDKYGVVEIDGGLVKKIIEKPSISQTDSQLVLCGRYLLPADTREIIEAFPISEFGEMQSIYLLRHIANESGLKAAIFDMQMYDSGDPISWLKSQIDHSLRRDDIAEEMRFWLEERLLFSDK